MNQIQTTMTKDERHETDVLLEKNKRVANMSDFSLEDFLYWPLESLADHVEKLESLVLNDKAGTVSLALVEMTDEFPLFSAEVKAIHMEFIFTCGMLHNSWKTEGETYLPYLREMCVSHAVSIPAFGSLSNVLGSSEEEAEKHIQALESIQVRIAELILTHYTGTVNAKPDRSLREFVRECRALQTIRYKILFPRAVEAENKTERCAEGVKR